VTPSTENGQGTFGRGQLDPQMRRAAPGQPHRRARLRLPAAGRAAVTPHLYLNSYVFDDLAARRGRPPASSVPSSVKHNLTKLPPHVAVISVIVTR